MTQPGWGLDPLLPTYHYVDSITSVNNFSEARGQDGGVHEPNQVKFPAWQRNCVLRRRVGFRWRRPETHSATTMMPVHSLTRTFGVCHAVTHHIITHSNIGVAKTTTKNTGERATRLTIYVPVRTCSRSEHGATARIACFMCQRQRDTIARNEALRRHRYGGCSKPNVARKLR